MELKKVGRIKASILLMACLLLNGIAFFPAFADGERQDHHKGRDEHYSRAEKERRGGHYSETDDDDKNGKERNEKEKGDEVTGFIAAGLFGLANLSTIFSALSRSITPLVGGRKSLKNALLVFTRFQQKHLRRYHYLPNIAAIAVASFHWYFSKSAVFSFQHWGIMLIIFLVFSGIMIKHRLLPQLLHRGLFNLHTSLFMSLAALSLLVAGHVFIDD